MSEHLSPTPAEPSPPSDERGSDLTAADAIAPRGQSGEPRRHRAVSRKLSGTTDDSSGSLSNSHPGSGVNISGSATGTADTVVPSISTQIPPAREPQPAAPLGVIGVCALDSKARSKPSRTILNRLIANGEFDVIIFGDKVILDEDVQNWPVCDFLISFFSSGFPLDKAIAYARLRRPYCVNDLTMQRVLWDRRLCLRILDSLDVRTPRRVEVNRDSGPAFPNHDVAERFVAAAGGSLDPISDPAVTTSVEISDDGDTLVVDGVTIRKPFVEKPVSGEDHNIHIYYASNEGGGGRRLFRKINNKSSEHDQSLHLPRCITQPESSYIYEEFLQAEGAEDIKAYTVGSKYCHAETRKSPVVDGLVKRNPSGKEVRYDAILSEIESSMASRIAVGFGQNVCGFDMLRAGGKSYVIDVNGWSFVKDNDGYYDHCASILRMIFLDERAKREAHQATSSNVTTPGGSLASPGLVPATTFDIVASRRASIPHQRPSSRIPSVGGSRAIASSSTTPAINPASVESKTGSDSRESSRIRSLAAVSSTSSLGSGRLDSQIEKSNSAVELGSLDGDIMMPPDEESNCDGADVAVEDDAVECDEAVPTAPPPASQAQWTLKGIVSVIRHGDRTPKQKFKFTFHTEPFVRLLKGHTDEVLLIGQQALQSVLSAVDEALADGIEDKTKLLLLKNSLIRKGGWPGTKVQIKPMFRKRRSADDVGGIILAPHDSTTRPAEVAVRKAEKDGASAASAAAARLAVTQTRSDSAGDVTLSRISAAEYNLVLDKLQLIIKWGGEPTHAATLQAQDLGDMLRNDMLLMNKSILDGVSVFSSSERRSTRSARVFAKHFLNDMSLPDNFVSIRKDLLDDSNAAKDEMDKVKKKLKMLLRKGDKAQFGFAWPEDMPEPYLVAREVVELMKFHRRVMHHNLDALEAARDPKSTGPAEVIPGAASFPAPEVLQEWCSGEDPSLFKERWEKLFAEFCDADKVDPSKISELYDSMKFDALHNRQFLEWVFTPSESMLDEYSAGEDDDETTIDAVVAGAQQLLQEQSYFNLFTGVGRLYSRAGADEDKSKKTSATTAAGGKAEPSPGIVRADTGGASGTVYDTTRFGGNDSRLTKMRELYRLTKVLFDYVGPQEYGMDNSEKLEIGLLTSLPLLKEIVHDLEELQASESGKGFFYFTKESHIYTLLNCIIEGGIRTKIERDKIPELDYLSQIFFELYESPDVPDRSSGQDRFKYSIRLSISPGCHTFDPLDVQLDANHCIGYAPRRSLTAHIDWKQIIETLRARFHTVKLPKTFIAVNLSEKVPHAFERAAKPPTPTPGEDGPDGDDVDEYHGDDGDIE